VINAKNRSTWFNHELLVGVKWKWKTASPFRLEPALDLRAFVGAVVVHDQVNFLIIRHRLLECLTRLGRDVHIVIKPTPRSRSNGRLTLSVA